MGEQGTTQLPAPRSSPPAQGGGGKRASVARTVEAATPIRQAISRVGMPPTNFTKHFAHMAHCGPLCWHQVPPLDSQRNATVRHQRRRRSIVQRSTRTTAASPPVGVTSQSAPRSLRGRRGVQESAAALASRGFRLLKIPSGSVPPISNRYNATTAVPQGLPPPFQSATWSLCSSCQTARKCLCHRHCSVVAV